MAFASLEECVDAIQGAAAVSGVKYAPTKPPEYPNDYPFVVTYPTTMRHMQGPAGAITYLYDIVVELHIDRGDLPNDVDMAYPYAESIPNAVYGILNTNAAASAGGSGRFGALSWGFDEDEQGNEVPHPTIGFSWTWSEVKIIKVMS